VRCPFAIAPLDNIDIAKIKVWNHIIETETNRLKKMVDLQIGRVIGKQSVKV
jgi:hypothetical protein